MKKYSKDKCVVFDTRNYTYFKGDKQLIPLTSFLSVFKNPFDSDKQAGKTAKKEGISKEEVLRRWKEKASQGTVTHSYFERYFESRELEYIESNKRLLVAQRFIKDYIITNRLIVIDFEFIVYNEYVAYQIDLLCKDIHDNYYIIDFKTNDNISENGFGKTLNGIFCRIPDSNYYHHSLTASLAKKMIKDYFISKMYIVQIKEDDYKFIECVDLAEEIEFNKIYKSYKQLNNL